MEIKIIDTGFFHADGGAMFGAIPKTAWSRRYPSDALNGCILAMRTLLVRTDDGHLILVDNGAGNKHLKLLSYYRFFQLIDLHEALRSLQIKPEDITDMVFTHLHFDHCGYTTLKSENCEAFQLAFPKAKHWVSRKQWENFVHPNALEKDSYFMENMQAAEEAQLLHLIDSETALCDSVQLRLFDGHTPGQIAPYITTPEQTFVFAGDVIPLAASVSPEWISAYDTHPLLSYQEKMRMLTEAVQEKQAIIFYHDAYTTCATVKRINHFFKKESVVDLEIFNTLQQ